MDSKHRDLEGHTIHYLEGGGGFPVLMIHGVGPGTSAAGNFGPVLEPLAHRFHIFAMDLVGFGASSRKPSAPFFDVDLWVRQGETMLDLMPDGPVGIAGHSMGGAIALKIAARSSRVAKVMTSCSVGVHYQINEALEGFWSVPKDRVALGRAMSRMVYSRDGLTDAMIEERWRLLTAPGYADYLAEVFAPPRQHLLDAAVLTGEELRAISADIVMLHGRDDQPCPPEQTTLPLARALPQADVLLYARCGHNLPRERSWDYVERFTATFGRRPLNGDGTR